MNEEMSNKLLSQATENIQKLFELSTRIDERSKTLKENYNSLDERLSDIERNHADFGANLRALSVSDGREDKINEMVSLQKALVEIDKRLTLIENTVRGQQTRWEKIGSLAIQLAWVLLLAWLLSVFKLQSPPGT